MKKFLNILIILCLVSVVSSCALFRNPDKAWENATSKVETATKAIDKNDTAILEKGKGYVYGTKIALAADPSTNKFHEVATILNDKAVETMGNPQLEEINSLRIMVANLLSDNTNLVVKGEKQLLSLDKKVIELQKENGLLQERLIRAEKKVIDVGTVNAGFASKWTSMIKIFWYAIYFIIAGFVIKIVAAVVPPPYNSIISIVSIPLGLVIKSIKSFVPEATKAAGVVTSEIYDNTKLALSHVVEAIEENKRDNPDSGANLAKYLKDVTSKEVTRPVITAIKKEMGYV